MAKKAKKETVETISKITRSKAVELLASNTSLKEPELDLAAYLTQTFETLDLKEADVIALSKKVMEELPPEKRDSHTPVDGKSLKDLLDPKKPENTSISRSLIHTVGYCILTAEAEQAKKLQEAERKEKAAAARAARRKANADSRLSKAELRKEIASLRAEVAALRNVELGPQGRVSTEIRNGAAHEAQTRIGVTLLMDQGKNPDSWQECERDFDGWAARAKTITLTHHPLTPVTTVAQSIREYFESIGIEEENFILSTSVPKELTVEIKKKSWDEKLWPAIDQAQQQSALASC